MKVQPPWINLKSTGAALVLAALALGWQAAGRANAPGSGDFFIISSVDLRQQQLLLKLPTEVTEVMLVDQRTRYFDETGKAIQLLDLRAGDTVYILSTRHGAGPPTAMRVRKGPMTIQELRQRYLPGIR